MNQNQPITPFAMRCTQEQFESVEDELNQMGYDTILAVGFTTFPYLTIWTGKIITSKCREFLVDTNTLICDTWNKSLFLKMAGKPDAESRELIGYKRNPEFDITYKDIGVLLRAEFYDFHISDIWEIEDCKGKGSEFFRRAQSLGIVGEGKWLVPVYKTEPEPIPYNPPHPFMESEVTEAPDEKFNAIFNKERWTSEKFLSDLQDSFSYVDVISNLKASVRYTDEQLTSMTPEDSLKLNADEWERYKVLQHSKSYREYCAKGSLRHLTYEQQKGGVG